MATTEENNSNMESSTDAEMTDLTESDNNIAVLKAKAKEDASSSSALANGSDNGTSNGDHEKNDEEHEENVDDNSIEDVDEDTNDKDDDEKEENDDDDDDDEKEENDDDDEIEEVDRVNGAAEDEEMEDDDEVEEIEEEDMDEDSNISEQSGSRESSKENGITIEKISRRKSPVKVREVEEIVDDSDEEEDENDVEEVKEDDSGSDSDIMEVEAEDPLAGSTSTPSQSSGKPKSIPSSSSSTPNVVTIDDVRTLHKLANAKRQPDPDKPVVIDTSTILAGKATSGVTITPARPKTNSPSIQSLPSGVTISSTKGPAVPLRGAGGHLSSVAATNTAFGYNQKGQLNDPNLTDDTFVVEAPSFIVPYVYEKPPKETFEDFKESVKKLVEESGKKKEEEEKSQKDEAAKAEEDCESKSKEDVESPESDKEKDKDKDEKENEEEDKKSDEKKKEDDDEIVEINKDKDTVEPKKKSASELYFESTLGKFLLDLGMNLVQESVQNDLLKQQIRKSHKDKSAAVMHAIMSLKKNLETSKEHNESFHLKEIKCRLCSFRTESEICLQHHLETPHMKNMMYRCNFCKYDTKLPQEVLLHMLNEHGVRGRLERAPAVHQCPQCPFEDNMKGKLTRHKNSCDKRFRPERNQEPPMDWEPPAKIPKPSVMPRRPGGGFGGYGTMGAAQQLSQLAHMRNQNVAQFQNRNIYKGMPQLQMGNKGRGRPVFQGDRIPSHLSMARKGMNQFSAFGKQNTNVAANTSMLQAMRANNFSGGKSILSNLGSNSSVTIQSVGNRNSNARSNTTPSISITPLPGRQNAGTNLNNRNRGSMNSMKPGQPAGLNVKSQSAAGKGSFVICEICDGYIKDLEQLRNHMLWIHKVKIHPKMIYNRPPLNCQKCQFRFFTDQGLERHLLGSHGLVTASMQDLANKGQDSGRCPVCGKVYQWKLLNHVAKDHQKTLKPAHLSYKCTVCTATFGQYKLFETHVYQAHSGAAKKGDKGKPAGATKNSTGALSKPPIKVPKDITVFSKPVNKPSTVQSKPAETSKKVGEEVIELDDDEEIDDDEEVEPKNVQKSSEDDKVEEISAE